MHMSTPPPQYQATKNLPGVPHQFAKCLNFSGAVAVPDGLPISLLTPPCVCRHTWGVWAFLIPAAKIPAGVPPYLTNQKISRACCCA